MTLSLAPLVFRRRSVQVPCSLFLPTRMETVLRRTCVSILGVLLAVEATLTGLPERLQRVAMLLRALNWESHNSDRCWSLSLSYMLEECTLRYMGGMQDVINT